MLPTFVVDVEASAYEGETMHCVGELERRGDYHHGYASDLMKALMAEFCKRLSAAAGEDAVKKFIAEVAQR